MKTGISFSEAIGGEVDALRDLWLWSRHLSPDYKSKFDGAIKTYFSSLMEHRTRRLRYSYNHIPRMLHYTLFFAASLVISLCLLVAVKDIWLDYIFTTSIALMAFVIYLVIDDLDHPLSHGNWHVTPIEYRFLLDRIENEPE